MVMRILATAVLFVVWFLVINIAWSEIFTIQSGYKLAGLAGISGDENVYNFIADISLAVSTIGACFFTFLSISLLRKK